jgi:hypothetical protein
VKTIALIAVFATVLIASVARAQPIGAISAGGSTFVSQMMIPEDTGGDSADVCTVPAHSLGVVTVAKRSGGKSRIDIDVADSIQTDGKNQILVKNPIAHSDGGSAVPNVLFIKELYSEPRKHYIVFHPRDLVPANYIVYCDFVDYPTQVLWASGRALLAYALSGTDLQPSDMASRSLNLGLSLIERDNVLAIGLDAFREELMIQLNKQFPNQVVLVTFLGAFFDNVAQEAYKHAFYEMSPHPLGR